MQWAWAHGHIASNPVSVVDHILPKRADSVEQRRPTMEAWAVHVCGIED
ncbi:hypothetical protein [Paraburkholderia atlantica]